ncbi:DUF3883 domain-containing protein [Streptomyces sp. NPDC046887]|uniref:protein NO VEIN domain-containing protein n=1 Tax=Streptomyces sp. NPDC046887 TaxID=3155472 RepID=UPI00340A6716
MPPDPVLRAAVRWLERLPTSGAARLCALFATHHDFSDITPTQYDAAYAWLQSTGLLNEGRSSVAVPRRVFDAAIAHSGAPWLPDADMLVRSPDELPDDVLRAASSLGLDEAEAFSHLRAVWGRVDARERERIGAAGEQALVGLLAASTDARVEHVAAWSDGFGYDIAVCSSRYPSRLEVKTTTRRRRLTVYLSRNEYETMRHDPCWELVALRLTADLQPEAVCTVLREWVASQVPADRARQGRWEACRLDVPPDAIVPGIPRLSPVLHEGCSPLLNGAAGWPT